MKNDEALVEVYRADHPPQAHVVRDRLEAEGIAARVEGDNLQMAMGGLDLGRWTGARVITLESDAPAARKIIEQIEREAAHNSPPE